jgi:Fe-S-cluster containining protein
MDKGLDGFIQGTFESYLEHSLSVLDGGNGVRRPFPYIAPTAESIYCRFLGEDHRCGIYEVRMSSCRAFPLGVVRNEDGNVSIQWFGDHCRIISDEAIFWRLVDNAIQNWNEGVETQIMLMNARDQLRDLGFGKYLGDEQRYMIDGDR